jgi:NADPH-dependent 2,4-dienoyl-CoA reductase/sulfur reductase-like enzyme
MTHLLEVDVVTAADKYRPAVARAPAVRRLSAETFTSMPHSNDREPILPTTNMAGGNKDGKKKVLVVGAGAAGMLTAYLEMCGY